MKINRYCLRCGTPGDRENHYLCWKCTASGDDWGSLIKSLCRSVLNYVEKFQAEASKQGTARALTIAEFQDLIRRAENETQKTLHTENAGS